MELGRYIGRGSLAFALVVMDTVMLALVSTVSPAVKLAAGSAALILGGSTVPTPDSYYINTVKRLRIGQWLHRGNGRQRDTLTGARPSASSSSEPFRLHKEMGSVHTKMAASS